jgi:hypothetical protein
VSVGEGTAFLCNARENPLVWLALNKILMEVKVSSWNKVGELVGPKPIFCSFLSSVNKKNSFNPTH